MARLGLRSSARPRPPVRKCARSPCRSLGRGRAWFRYARRGQCLEGPADIVWRAQRIAALRFCSSVVGCKWALPGAGRNSLP
eukprot:9844802-Alexandrium_andersonii.AAC.1